MSASAWIKSSQSFSRKFLSSDAFGVTMLSTSSIFFASAQPGVWSYFKDSNLAGQFIVLILLGLSVLTWAIMLSKYRQLKRLKALNDAFEEAFYKQKSIQNLRISRQTEVPYAYLTQVLLTSHQSEPGSQEFVQSQMDAALMAQNLRYESRMVLLSSIITGAPFLGLLGTVWGVMDAFGSVSGKSSVSLQVLAPGVSGALLTTVAALLVAIPSVFGYNFLLSLTRQRCVELEGFCSRLLDHVSRQFKAQR